jgi:hypothetical protein
VAIAAGVISAAAALYWVFQDQPEEHDRPRRQRLGQPPAPPSTNNPPQEQAHQHPVSGRKEVVVSVCSSLVLSLVDGVVEWRDGAEKWLSQLLGVAHVVVLVEGCTSDQLQTAAMTSLAAVGVPTNRCVFCELPESVVHIARHLSSKVRQLAVLCSAHRHPSQLSLPRSPLLQQIETQTVSAPPPTPPPCTHG